MTDLVMALREHSPGTTLAVVYLRDGERHTSQVTLGAAPSR
jgi:S1-C subfamily serine protease